MDYIREIELLKGIIKEIEEKYRILEDNNGLLKENCELLKNSFTPKNRIENIKNMASDALTCTSMVKFPNSTTKTMDSDYVTTYASTVSGKGSTKYTSTSKNECKAEQSILTHKIKMIQEQ